MAAQAARVSQADRGAPGWVRAWRTDARKCIGEGSASSGLRRHRRNGSAGAVEREETDDPPAFVSYRTVGLPPETPGRT